MQLTRVAIIVIVVIILILSFVSLYYWKHPESRGQIHDYLSTISGLGVLMVLVTFVITSYYQDVQLADLHNDGINQIRRRLYSDTLNTYIKYYPYLNRLYSQLYPEQHIPVPTITDTDKRDSLEMLAMSELLQVVEEVVMLNAHSSWSEGIFSAWIATFQSWFQSPLLQHYWTNNAKYYDPQVDTFIQRLINAW